jgi:hypothetical protein
VKNLWHFDVQVRFIEAFELEHGRRVKLCFYAGDEERIAALDAVPLSSPKQPADLEERAIARPAEAPGRGVFAWGDERGPG